MMKIQYVLIFLVITHLHINCDEMNEDNTENMEADLDTDHEKAISRFPIIARLMQRIPDLLEKWKEFKKKYRSSRLMRRWNRTEEIMRLKIFGSNLAFIQRFNRKKNSYNVTINELSAYTREEYDMILGTYNENLPELNGPTNVNLNVETAMIDKRGNLPPSKNWLMEGKVSSVKNQGQCGSCYAFSTVGALESAVAIKTGRLYDYSEQAIVDCSISYGNKGCNGGSLVVSHNFLMQRTISDEASYPYRAKVGTCNENVIPISKQISGYSRVAYASEAALMTAIAEKGPVAASIDSSRDGFRFYSDGIYKDSGCSNTSLNHGVLIVGYGSTPEPYWLVKNSWGTTWGNNGYIRMARNFNNMCGVASHAVYPLL